MTEKEIASFGNIINNSKKILITTHINPDGDGIGSGLALVHKLKKMNKEVHFINRDLLPKIYEFLPGSKKVKNQKKIKGNYDAAIILECPEIERNGNIIDYKKQVKTTVNIDHHMGNTNFADINIVDPKAAAVGIQIFKLMKGLGWEINKEVADCIYVSIITDTGSFRYSNTTSEVHTIAAELLDIGVDPDFIASEVYATTKNSTRLFTEMLKRLKVIKNVGWSFITKKMLKESGAHESETDNFINTIRAIKEVEVAILFKENNEGNIKASFRSKNGIDVNLIAKKFGGGGHMHASGCVIKESMKKAEKMVLTEIFKYLKNGKKNEDNKMFKKF